LHAVPMAARVVDVALQNSTSEPVVKGSICMTQADAERLVQEIKLLDAKAHEAECLLKSCKQMCMNTRYQTGTLQSNEKSREPRDIEISSFITEPPLFINEPLPKSASPDPSPPGFEDDSGFGPPGLSKPWAIDGDKAVVTNVLEATMSLEQAHKLVEEIKKLEKLANLLETWLYWCSQPTLPHHNVAWGVLPHGQPWHHPQTSAQMLNCSRLTANLKNVPSYADFAAREEILRRNGFDKKFSLSYAPRDCNTGQGDGIGLVNMVAPENADALMKAVDRRRDQESWGGTRRWSEQAQAVWANDQRLDAYLKYRQNHQVIHSAASEKFKPAYFVDGQRRFPKRTKSIKKTCILRRKGVEEDDKEDPKKILSTEDTAGVEK